MSIALHAQDEARLREDLKEDIKVLRTSSKVTLTIVKCNLEYSGTMQDVDTERMWQRYEALMSSLTHSLCEELRLALQPTQASRLK